MNEFDPEEVKRTIGVLKNVLGITSRDDFDAKVDQGANLIQLDDIGEERAPIVSALWDVPDEEWEHVTGLPLHTPRLILPD